MNRLTTFRAPFRPLAALMAFFASLTLTSCSRHDGYGGYTMWGALILILDIVAMIDVLRQNWDLGKKILWIAIIYFLPVLGLILYYLLAGRNKS